MELIKVAITGPESAGKSTLTKALAEHFKATYTTEFARSYLAGTNGYYTYDDLSAMCQGQKSQENKAIEMAEQICFFDTDMLVLKIWSQFRFGRVPELIEQAFIQRKYDLHLLCKPDLLWTPDDFRESPHQAERDLLYMMYKNHLSAARMPYAEIFGTGDEREKMAISEVEKHFQLA